VSRRVLVTGGAGFIGSHLVARLAAEPETEVVVGDDFSRGARDRTLLDLEAGGGVRLVDVDVTRPDTLAALGPGPFDEIYHLAAILGVERVLARPLRVLDVNLGGTLALLHWLDGVEHGRLLLASTSEVYAWTRRFHELPVPTPEDVPLAVTDVEDPRASYATSKIAAELAVAQWGRADGRERVTVRYHNVYGPRMGHDHVIPQVYARAAAGQDPLVVYSPRHRRAFCFVDDAVDATLLAMRTDAAGGATINIGNDREEISIEELAVRLLAAAGLPPRALDGQAAPNDPVDRRCPDVSRARTLLGYEPRVPLEEGLRRTVAWYARELAETAS
jgi:UDP-glucose 4-epimerase/UDP-glucuronate decarboxylase